MVSFFNFLNPESPALRWSQSNLHASKVRPGLKDSKDVKLGLQHWIEAILDALFLLFRCSMRPYASRGAGTSPYSIPSIWAYSGHYRPSEENLNNFLSSLREKRVNLDEAHTSSNGYYYADPKLDQADKVIKSMTSREPRQPKMPLKIEKSPIVEPSAVSETEASVKGDEGANGSYKSTLSGGLQSQRADVPQKVILDRIKLKREARLYQLGNQLSMKWCTGAGPRIGCVADYPVELRMQALELVNLSPT